MKKKGGGTTLGSGMKKKGGGTTVREEVGGVRDGGAGRTGGRRCGVEARGREAATQMLLSNSR